MAGHSSDPEEQLILVVSAREEAALLRTVREIATHELLSGSVVDETQHRLVLSNQALLQREFVGQDLWRYGHRRLPAPELPRVTGWPVTVTAKPDERTLTVHAESGHVLAEATIGLPVQGIGAGVDQCRPGRAETGFRARPVGVGVGHADGPGCG